MLAVFFAIAIFTGAKLSADWFGWMIVYYKKPYSCWQWLYRKHAGAMDTVTVCGKKLIVLHRKSTHTIGGLKKHDYIRCPLSASPTFNYFKRIHLLRTIN